MYPLSDSSKIPLPDLTNVKFVLFDAVGTLIFPHPSPAEVYHDVGHRHGHRLSLEEVRQRFSKAFRKHHVSGATEEMLEYQRWQKVIADVFETPEESDLFRALWDQFSQPQSWRVYDDVADTFAALQQRAIPFGIASNFDERLIRLCRDLRPLNQVDRIFHSSAIGWSKPHPGFFSVVQERLELEPSNILLVGDDEVKDLGGAQGAGWHALLIDRNADANESQKIRSLTQVLEYLR